MAKITVSQPCEPVYTLVLTESEIVALDAITHNESDRKVYALRSANPAIYSVNDALDEALRG